MRRFLNFLVRHHPRSRTTSWIPVTAGTPGVSTGQDARLHLLRFLGKPYAAAEFRPSVRDDE